jgi:hypothetical protein
MKQNKDEIERFIYLHNIWQTNKNPWALTDQRVNFSTRFEHVGTLTSMAVPHANCPVHAARKKLVRTSWK